MIIIWEVIFFARLRRNFNVLLKCFWYAIQCKTSFFRAPSARFESIKVFVLNTGKILFSGAIWTYFERFCCGIQCKTLFFSRASSAIRIPSIRRSINDVISKTISKPSENTPVGKEPKRGKGGGISARNSTDGMDYGMSSMRCKLQKDVNWHFRWLSWWCVFRSVCDHDDSLLQYWAKNKMRFEAVEFARGRATDCTSAYRSRFLINKWFQLIVFDQTLLTKIAAISDFSPTWNQNSFTNLSVGAQTLWSCSTHQFYHFWKFHRKILIFSEVIDDFRYHLQSRPFVRRLCWNTRDLK